jgi:hypothetical protein
MTEPMIEEIEAEEFTEELSDEALDRAPEGGSKICTTRCLWCGAGS